MSWTDFEVGEAAIAIAVSDFNADGRLDRAVANFNSDNISVRINPSEMPPVSTPEPTTVLGFILLGVLAVCSNAGKIRDYKLFSKTLKNLVGSVGLTIN